MPFIFEGIQPKTNDTSKIAYCLLFRYYVLEFEDTYIETVKKVHSI